MWVKNRKGTDAPPCPCGSWLKHWERGSGSKATFCAVAMCWKRAEIGRHVLKTLGSDRGEYIVPLCAACTTREEDFESLVAPVPAGLQTFCG